MILRRVERTRDISARRSCGWLRFCSCDGMQTGTQQVGLFLKLFVAPVSLCDTLGRSQVVVKSGHTHQAVCFQPFSAFVFCSQRSIFFYI